MELETLRDILSHVLKNPDTSGNKLFLPFCTEFKIKVSLIFFLNFIQNFTVFLNYQCFVVL